MYLVDKSVKDENNHSVVQSLIKSARAIETNIRSVLIEEEKKEQEKSIYEKLEIIEDIPVSELINYKKLNCDV